MTPPEFEALTPVEVSLMLEAALRRQAREEHLLAILGCWLLAPWSKRRLTPDKLMKPTPGRPGLVPTWWPDPAKREPR